MNYIEVKYGKTVEETDLIAYRSEGKFKGNKYIYLIAGTHGDEVEGVYLVDQLFSWIKTNEAIDYPIVVVPIYNMDGYRSGTRQNSHGVDLNRNFPTSTWNPEPLKKKFYPGQSPASEPETESLLKLFEKYPPALILSFHTWTPMINIYGDCEELGKTMSEMTGYELVIGDVEGNPTPGSLADYCKEVLKCPLLTFECQHFTDELGLKEVWEKNRPALQFVFSNPDVYLQSKEY